MAAEKPLWGRREDTFELLSLVSYRSRSLVFLIMLTMLTMNPSENPPGDLGRDARHRILDSPTGSFYVMCTDAGLVETGWFDMLAGPGGSGRTVELLGKPDPKLLPDFCQRLLQAMSGRHATFDDMETPPGTGFQRAVWNAARLIPPGTTITYGQLADRVDRPNAARAVGQVMRRNRLPIVIPCHRVIGAGDLGGFGGQGPKGRWPAIKRMLLEAESLPRP